MDTSSSLLLSIVDETTLANAMQAAHDGGLDQAHRSVNVMIFNPWYQDLLALLEQVFLDGADMLDIADVLVKLWVNCHVLRSDCEALSMLVLILDIKHERDAGWILRHHFLQKAHGQMHTFYNQRLIALVKTFNDFPKLFGDQSALLLVPFKSNPIFASILSLFLRYHISCFVC